MTTSKEDIDINFELELLKKLYADVMKSISNSNLIEETYYEYCDCNLIDTRKQLELLYGTGDIGQFSTDNNVVTVPSAIGNSDDMIVRLMNAVEKQFQFVDSDMDPITYEKCVEYMGKRDYDIDTVMRLFHWDCLKQQVCKLLKLIELSDYMLNLTRGTVTSQLSFSNKDSALLEDLLLNLPYDMLIVEHMCTFSGKLSWSKGDIDSETDNIKPKRKGKNKKKSSSKYINSSNKVHSNGDVPVAQDMDLPVAWGVEYVGESAMLPLLGMGVVELLPSDFMISTFRLSICHQIAEVLIACRYNVGDTMQYLVNNRLVVLDSEKNTQLNGGNSMNGLGINNGFSYCDVAMGSKNEDTPISFDFDKTNTTPSNDMHSMPLATASHCSSSVIDHSMRGYTYYHIYDQIVCEYESLQLLYSDVHAAANALRTTTASIFSTSNIAIPKNLKVKYDNLIVSNDVRVTIQQYLSIDEDLCKQLSILRPIYTIAKLHANLNGKTTNKFCLQYYFQGQDRKCKDVRRSIDIVNAYKQYQLSYGSSKRNNNTDDNACSSRNAMEGDATTDMDNPLLVTEHIAEEQEFTYVRRKRRNSKNKQAITNMTQSKTLSTDEHKGSLWGRDGDSELELDSVTDLTYILYAQNYISSINNQVYIEKKLDIEFQGWIEDRECNKYDTNIQKLQENPRNVVDFHGVRADDVVSITNAILNYYAPKNNKNKLNRKSEFEHQIIIYFIVGRGVHSNITTSMNLEDGVNVTNKTLISILKTNNIEFNVEGKGGAIKAYI